MRVHFICRGNAYRSIIAEAYVKSQELPGVDVVSSGIVADEYSAHNVPVRKFTYEYLQRKGLGTYAKQSSTQLTQETISDSDITICMNQRVVDECKGKVVLPPSTIVWDINDNDADETENPPTNDDELTEFTNIVLEHIKRNIDELVDAAGFSRF